jgi:hydroxymethylpyrimidine/phosphomethylpyrimidine kinase
MKTFKTCLSIAGFDGSGGAGLQADLKTFSSFGCYGMNVLTALPVQNTQGVHNCYTLPLQAIKDQLDAIFDDIRPDSIKIGMLFSHEIIECIATFLQANARGIPIVLDPVMVAKSGDRLLLQTAIDALRDQLIPLTTIITPNLPEAYELVGKIEDMNELAAKLLKLGSKAVLLKGGHAESNESNDLYLDQDANKLWINSPRIVSNNTHGTGCTLSAAIAACLALGMPLMQACQTAKQYTHDAINAAKDLSLGKGHGPVHHFYQWWGKLQEVV